MTAATATATAKHSAEAATTSGIHRPRRVTPVCDTPASTAPYGAILQRRLFVTFVKKLAILGTAQAKTDCFKKHCFQAVPKGTVSKEQKSREQFPLGGVAQLRYRLLKTVIAD